MAAHSHNFIRVRLYFDYPPPAVIDCRMCWLLVDLNACRVVADLESIIRDKFEFSRGSTLNLFIEDCYLPHTESIFVVRDNDSVRVKVDCVAPQARGNSSCPDAAGEKCRKRQRATEDDGPGENGVSVEWKKKRRKKGSEEMLGRDAKQASGDERKKKKSRQKHKEKEKKKKKAEQNGPTVTPKPPASTKKPPVRADEPAKGNKKPPAAQAKTQNVSSSDSSSSSEEDEAPKKSAAQKPAPKTPSSTPAAPKAPPSTKPTHKKPNPPSSSSSSDTSSSDEDTSVKNKPATSATPKGRISDNSKSQQAPPALQSMNCAQKQAPSAAAPPPDKVTKPCTSDSEEEIELVIRRPLQQQLGPGAGSPSSWRGRGRGKPRRGGGPAERGRGEGRGGTRGHNGSFGFNYNGANNEPSYQSDSLTNVSVVLQNGAESAPKPDYSSMPLLAAPPQVGQKIAFKLLELTENYTPEVSEYKEGKIVSFDHATKQIELELPNASRAPIEPGKFDLVYQNPDGSERVEYAVSRGSRVTERWDSLLEPRLII